eukprot:SAG31_NODE_12424_length_943_cov_1.036730_1_plen_120_part_10
MQHHDWSSLMAKTNGSDPSSSSVHIANQPTCSQVAASMDGSPFEGNINNGQSIPSCSSSMRYHDWPRLMAKTNKPDPSSCVGKITHQLTCSQIAASISRRSMGPFESPADAKASFTQSYS